MNFLTREDVLEMDIPRKDTEMYLSCLDNGGEICLVSGTIYGDCHLVLGFNPNGSLEKLPGLQ